jgi:hypothetical protein
MESLAMPEAGPLRLDGELAGANGSLNSGWEVKPVDRSKRMSTLRWTSLRLRWISRVEISHRASRSRMSLITGEALS